MKDVSLVITSCGRFDLLKRTLDSFFEKNTYPSILGIDGAKLALEQEINQAKQAILSIPNETTVQRQVQEIFMKILSYVEI